MTSEERAQLIGLCATLAYVGLYVWTSMSPLDRRIARARIRDAFAGVLPKKRPPVSRDDVLAAHDKLLTVATLGDLR